jgi:hypothetical protein
MGLRGSIDVSLVIEELKGWSGVFVSRANRFVWLE